MFFEINGREVDVPDCMAGFHSCRECPRYMDDCDGNDSVCLDEGDEILLKEIASLTEDLLFDVKDFAWKQWDQFDEGEEKVAFEYEGQSIKNPWIDASGRFQLDTVKAIEIYGKENMISFVKAAIEQLKH